MGGFIIFLRTQIPIAIEETISEYDYLKIKSLINSENNDKLRKIMIMHKDFVILMHGKFIQLNKKKNPQNP